MHLITTQVKPPPSPCHRGHLMSSCSRLIPPDRHRHRCNFFTALSSRHYTGDSIEYALAIELTGPPSADPSQSAAASGLAWPFRPGRHLAGTGQSLVPLQSPERLWPARYVPGWSQISCRLTGLARPALSDQSGGSPVSGGLGMLSVERNSSAVPLAAAPLILWTSLCCDAGASGQRKRVRDSAGAGNGCGVLELREAAALSHFCCN